MESSKRNTTQGMLRGMFLKCPNCGQGHLFKAYLKVHDNCQVCDFPLKNFPADDAPPYIVISLVGTIIVPLAFLSDYLWDMSELLLLSIWLPVSIFFILGILPPVKGSFIGILWALNLSRKD